MSAAGAADLSQPGRRSATCAIVAVALAACGSRGGEADGVDDPLALDNCATELPSPPLVLVRADGSAFCMDATEVTQAEFAAFLLAAGGVLQTGDCSWNTPAAPCVDRPDSECPAEGDPCAAHFDPDGTPDRRMGCVDWCDAKAYCEWAGKRLCAGLEGQAVPLDAQLEMNPPRSEWQFACTQGGKTPYPYGESYEPGRCLDGNAGVPVATLAEEGSSGWPTCRGAMPPYDRIQDLAGSQLEWTAVCDENYCAVEGGHLTSEEASCAAGGQMVRGDVAEALGFRCCAHAS